MASRSIDVENDFKESVSSLKLGINEALEFIEGRDWGKICLANLEVIYGTRNKEIWRI